MRRAWLVALGLFATPLWAQQQAPRRQALIEQITERFMENFRQQAGLTPEQYQKFRGVTERSLNRSHSSIAARSGIPASPSDRIIPWRIARAASTFCAGPGEAKKAAIAALIVIVFPPARAASSRLDRTKSE